MLYPPNRLPISMWSEGDRPREKMLGKGRQALSDAELLAIIIGSGTRHESALDLSRRLLHNCGGSLDMLARMTVADLCGFAGIGEARAVSIVAALEIGRRRKNLPESSEEILIRTSQDSYRLILPELADLDHEEFWIILLTRSNRFMRKELLSKGGMNATIVDPRLMFRSAILQGACGIVLCHNHPSGSVRPSESDIRLTRRLKEAGVFLEITVLDHIIVGTNTYFSFADDGIL